MNCPKHQINNVQTTCPACSEEEARRQFHDQCRREQRERIAIAALHGLYANGNTWSNVPEVRQQLRTAVIEDALALADELIAALNKS